VNLLERLFRSNRKPDEANAEATTRSAERGAAELANAAGNEASAAGDRETACQRYRESIRLDPGWSSPWFNLGLEHKRLRRWRESLEANRRALELKPGKGPAAWNLGIAATALGDWTEARRAWKACEIEIPDGVGPIVMTLGRAPIRVNVEDAPEVVWCRRVDPARAIIENVPFPESGRCLGDVVLHDGAPAGYRMLGSREVAVFDELELLTASQTATWTVGIRCTGAQDAAVLIEGLERRGIVAEDWTVQTQLLCKECSEGRPHERCERRSDRIEAGPETWTKLHRLGIASENEAPIVEALTEWSSGAEGRVHADPEWALRR
jgi:hypothetical protein